MSHQTIIIQEQDTTLRIQQVNVPSRDPFQTARIQLPVGGGPLTFVDENEALLLTLDANGNIISEKGFLELSEQVEPALSASGKVRIYFDNTEKMLKFSADGNAYVLFDGGVSDPLTVNGWTPTSGTGTITGELAITGDITKTSATTFILTSNEADGAGAIGFQFQVDTNLVAAGTKIISLGDNSGVAYAEKAHFTLDGGLNFLVSGTGIAMPTAGHQMLIRSFGSGNTIRFDAGLNTVAMSMDGFVLDLDMDLTKVSASEFVITSNVPDSASAVGHRLKTNVTLATAGARHTVFDNNGVDILVVDKDGGLVVGGNIELGNNFIQSDTGAERLMLFGNTSIDFYIQNNSFVDARMTASANGTTFHLLRTTSVNSGVKIGANTTVGVPVGIFTVEDGLELQVIGMRANGAANITVKIGADNDVTTAGHKLVSIGDNFGVTWNEVFAFRHDGALVGDGTNIYFDPDDDGVNEIVFEADGTIVGGGSPFKFRSLETDSASAVGYEFDTENTLVTAGSKHTSFINNGVELGHITFAGFLNFPVNGGVKHQLGDIRFGGTGSSQHEISAIGGAIMQLTNGGSFNFISDEVNGASAVAFFYNITTGGGLSTAGAKLVSWQNNTVEKAFIDKDGGITFEGDLDHNGTNVGFYGTAPVAQSAAYTRNATVVEDRTLLASASATTINNNNVLAALIADLQALGLIG